METGKSKLSGHRERMKFTVRGKRCSSHKQIRICMSNTASDEESTAAGNQLYTPELLHVLILSKTKETE